MKINLQKIIVSMVVITVAISILNISVHADDTPLGGSENGGGGSGGNRDVVALNEFETAFADVTQKYVDGDITYTEWNEQQNALLEDFYSKNTSASGDVIAPAYTIGKRFEGIARKIGDTVNKFGDDARQRVADWWNGVTSDVPTETVQTPTTDYMGRGATMYIYDKLLQGNGSYLDYYKIQACDYIVIEPYNGNGVEQYKLHFYGYIDSYSSVDAYGRPVELHLTGTSSKNYLFLVCDYENGKFTHGSKEFEYRLLYGDVRYVDGTQFPTGEEFEISTKKDFDNMPAPDLDDLLDDFQTKLENEDPDLDEIEDILKAIYWKLKQKEDDKVTPDDLNSLINSAVNQLLSKDCACDDILALLQDMKLCDNVQDIRDKLYEIYPDYDFEREISDIEALKTKFLAKWSFIKELQTLIQRFMSSYEKNSSLNAENVIHVQYHPSNGSLGNAILNVSGSYDIKFDIFKPYLPTVRSIIAAFIYLSYAWNTYRKIPSYIRGGDAT